MTRTLLAAALLALMVPATGRADDSDAKKEVAQLSQRTHEALIAGDTATLESIQTEDWLVIGPTGEVVGKARQAKDLKDGTTDFLSMDPSEVKVRVYGDTAVVTGRYKVKLKDKGQETGGNVRISEFFAKVGGKWKNVSSQVTFIAEPPKENR